MTCTKCGSDVTGKKFCPDCGTPVQQSTAPGGQTCPNCHNEVKPDAAFCIHCGTALHAAAPVPAPTTCPVCHNTVASNTDFCTNCGHDMRLGASQTQVAATQAAVSSIACPTCGYQNAATMRFCGQCGGALQASATTQGSYGQGQNPYQQQPYGQGQNPYQQQPYGQNPYQQQGQYQQAPQYYNNQVGYQGQQVMGQGPMVLRCPVCMAMAPVGTPNCVSCHTSLAGVVATPANMPVQGQQGGFLQGNGGGMAMGALGGVAAVIGGEMLLHGIENSIEGRDDEGWRHRRRDDGLLGGLGNVIDDIGL